MGKSYTSRHYDVLNCAASHGEGLAMSLDADDPITQQLIKDGRLKAVNTRTVRMIDVVITDRGTKALDAGRSQ